MKSYYRRQRQKKRLLAFAALILVMLLFIPARLAIAINQAPKPQAILVLGGGEDREQFAAQVAEFYPSLKIWVSSGIPPNKSHAIFKAPGIADRRVYLDYRATDTVTNFTTLVRVFQQLHIQHLFLVTSDYHMPRAKAIAPVNLSYKIILGIV